MPNSACASGRACAALQRCNHATLRCIASRTRSIGTSAAAGGQSSKAMMMSAPIRFCARMLTSGVMRTFAPSTNEEKVTPSSSSVRMSAMEKAWKPPESVRMGPFHRMKAWLEPNFAMRSAPGRSMQCSVLFRMIWLPVERTCSGVSPFMAAAVATGMKAGVSKTPCGVCTRPSRAPFSLERCRISSRTAMPSVDSPREASGVRHR